MSYNQGGSAGSSNRGHRLIGEDEDSIPLGRVLDAVQGEAVYEVRRVPPVNTSGPVLNSTIVKSVLTGDLNVVSDLDTRSDMHRLRMLYDIPDWVNLHAPDRNLRANHCLPGYVCMYTKPFEDGLRLPLPGLVVQFLRRHRLSPGQLMPNVWRVLMAMQVFSEIEKFDFDVDVLDVLHSYRVKECNQSGRFQMSLRRDHPRIITNITDGNKKWKSEYFFMSYEGLGILSGDDIPSHWTHGSGIGVDSLVTTLDLETRVSWFTKFPESQRDWRVILSPENLRRSTLWSQVPPGPEGIVIPPTQIRSEIVCSTRALQVLKGDDVSLIPFDELTPDERAYADYVMSSKMNLIPSKDAVEMLMERKGKKAKAAKGKKGGSSTDHYGDVDPQVNLSSSRNKKKRAALPAVPDCSDSTVPDGMVHLSISADTCAQTDYESCIAQMEKLLFKGDEARLDGTGGVVKALERAAEYSFQHYQVMLYLKKNVGAMGSALTEASSKCDALLEEIGSSTQRWLEMEKALRGDLVCKEEEIATLRSEMSAVKETLKAREEQIKDIFLETVIITRGQDYQEYEEGKAPTWDTAKGIRAMRSVLREREGLPADEEDESSGDDDGEGDGNEDAPGVDDIAPAE